MRQTVCDSSSSVMSRRLFILFLLVFAASGFTALIYESVWAKYLKLVFGHAAYGQTMTLFLFMGGIGAGALTMGRYVK